MSQNLQNYLNCNSKRQLTSYCTSKPIPFMHMKILMGKVVASILFMHMKILIGKVVEIAS